MWAIHIMGQDLKLCNKSYKEVINSNSLNNSLNNNLNNKITEIKMIKIVSFKALTIKKKFCKIKMEEIKLIKIFNIWLLLIKKIKDKFHLEKELLVIFKQINHLRFNNKVKINLCNKINNNKWFRILLLVHLFLNRNKIIRYKKIVRILLITIIIITWNLTRNLIIVRWQIYINIIYKIEKKYMMKKISNQGNLLNLLKLYKILKKNLEEIHNINIQEH